MPGKVCSQAGREVKISFFDLQMVTRQTYRLDMNPFKCQNCQGTSNFLFTCCIQHSGDIYMAITCTAVGRGREKKEEEDEPKSNIWQMLQRGTQRKLRDRVCCSAASPQEQRNGS